MSLPKDVQEISEDAMRRIAKIIGFQSAAQAALDDAERRRANGEQPIFLISPSTHMFFVGNDLGSIPTGDQK